MCLLTILRKHSCKEINDSFQVIGQTTPGKVSITRQTSSIRAKAAQSAEPAESEDTHREPTLLHHSHMDDAQNDPYPAINRALAILRERYKDHLENNDNNNGLIVQRGETENDDARNNSNDSLEEDYPDPLDCPQILRISPEPQEIKSQPNLFHGLAQRAKYLQRKQKNQTPCSPELLLKARALDKALRLCEHWCKLSSSFLHWRSYCEVKKERKRKFLMILNRQQQTLSPVREHRYREWQAVSERFSNHFSLQFRRSCLERFGKRRLSQIYDDWRLCRSSFSLWILSMT
jgi:hypothetical protein